MMKNLFLFICTSLLLFSCKEQNSMTPADYVNPFIGASTSTADAGVYHGLGKTFPGAATPFGLVQVSPNTITGGDNGSGYSYEHKTIEGFAFTQMSGIGWNGDLGNFLVMPTTGPLIKIAGLEDGSIKGYRSQYDKNSEKASAGYYAVRLTDYDILTECSATPHCGILKFTYPQSDMSRIQIDLARRVGGCAQRQYIKVINDNTIIGWIKCTPETGGWGDGQGNAEYTVHFYAQFSIPLSKFGIWKADIPSDWSRKNEDVVSLKYLEHVANATVYESLSELEGDHLGFYTEFPTQVNEEITLKVGISFVDIQGAENNFNKEIAEISFDEVKSKAKRLWNDELRKITVTGGTEEDKTIFYTALYHASLDPRTYTDVDGRYVGGDLKIHDPDSSFVKRTIFSGWDVFRSEMPLQTIINPTLVNDLINSLVTMADQSGKEYFERWELLNAYSGCMLGNPALSIIADAYAKGIRGFDAEKAFLYAENSSSKFGNGSLGWSPTSLCISETLEYGYFDWCLSRFASMLGNKEKEKYYYDRGQAYRNIFDKEHGWFRPRKADGSWAPWPENARLKEWYGCIESNSYQQGWFVPHDIPGMVELMGGVDSVLTDLTSFFENTPEDLHWNPYYNHANEPVHFVPFLFNELGQPWNTQKWTRLICQNGYKNEVAGLVGNDDVGQMSAWYVLAASGIHPICPGDTKLEITSPVFETITFELDPKYYKGKQFKIITKNNNPSNIYIQKALLNGQELDKPYIDFSELASGGILELLMGPNKPPMN